MLVNHGEVYEIQYSSSFSQCSQQAHQKLGISEFDQNSEKKRKKKKKGKETHVIKTFFILFELAFFFIIKI